MKLEEALKQLDKIEESKLNEAPDNLGFETDDEIEAQERAEFEKRLAQRKADRDTAKKQELDRQEQERQQELARQEAEKKGKEILEKVKDLPFDDWFDYLVPKSGKADTVAGEIYRAIARIDYRFFNDGDVFYKGYGRDTCGSSVAYLMEVVDNPLINDFYDIAEDHLDDGEYENAIEKIKDNLKDYLLDNPELFGTINDQDSRDSKVFDLDIEIPEPKDFEYTIYLGDYYTEDSYGDDVYLKDYIDKGIIDIWEVQDEVNDILRWESIDFSMERPWTHYDTEINLTDMTEDDYNKVKELVDDSHFLDDYISDLIEKHGLPDEQEVDESLKESKNNIPEKANLKKILDRYNSNGKFAKQGSWKIARGGYDLAFQLYYNDLALIDGINDGFSNKTTLELDQDTYGKNDEYDVKDLANYICQVYTDCEVNEKLEEKKTNLTPTEQIADIIKSKLSNSKYLVFEEKEHMYDDRVRLRYHFNNELINQARDSMKNIIEDMLIDIEVADYSDDYDKEYSVEIYSILDIHSSDWCESLILDSIDKQEIVDYLEDTLGDDALLDNAQNNDTWEESLKESKDKVVLILDDDLSTSNARTPQGCAYKWDGKEPLEEFAKRCYEGNWKDGELIRDFENESHDDFSFDWDNNILHLVDYNVNDDEDDRVSNFKFDYYISGQNIDKDNSVKENMMGTPSSMSYEDYIEEALDKENIDYSFFDGTYTFRNWEDYKRAEDIICNIVGEYYDTYEDNLEVTVYFDDLD